MFNRHVLLPITLCALALIALVAPGSASAAVGGPQWTVTAYSGPTNLAQALGSKGLYRVQVQNTGDGPSDGSTITVSDVLPAGLKAASEPASGVDWQTATAMSCVGLTCTYGGVVPSDDILDLTIPVEVEEGAPASVTNLVTVSGGGAPEVARETPTTIGSTPAPFGFAPGSTAIALSSTQAGGHPDLTAVLAYNTVGNGLLAGDPKDSGATLPPGFVGDLADTPKCPIAEFSRIEEGSDVPLHCSLSTQVGTATVNVTNGEVFRGAETVPVFNVTTNPGEISKLGFSIEGYGIQGTVSLRPGNYGVRTLFQSILDNDLEVAGISLTIWGVPSDPIHDLMRGRVCAYTPGSCEYDNATEISLHPPNGQPSTSLPIPYLTAPTACTGEPLKATLEADSWQEPGRNVTASSPVGPMAGCDLLEFAPSVTSSPDTARADTPAGFTFGVRMGQEGLVNEAVNSESDIQGTTVTLPEGVVVNPGQANGLGACQMPEARLEEEGPPTCPSDSRVGQVAVETPILRNKLEGNVYVLKSNPPELKLLVAPEDPTDGLYVKFVGDVHLDETTGRLTTTFEKTPQLPFSNLKFSFSGGAQAALATPLACGAYTANTDFAPWSAPFVAEAFPSSSFAITEGPDGSACPSSPAPFAPSLDAGSTTDQAGGFTDFSLLLTRGDGQQRISTLQFKTPEGLLGMISKVPLCGEPQAANGKCPATSQIGHTVVEAGPGPYPLVVPQPGQPPAPIYLTGGYEGAPYGLSIVVPLVVGPFDLGTIVTRAKIEVDPHTSQLTVTTDPLPSIVHGVPSDLRTINAVIDRPGFMFNPTDCSPMSFSGTAVSTEGASAPISSHFQVGSCRSLKFKPDLKVSTSGKTSRANGASLDAKLLYPTGPLGNNQASSQSNVARVKVELPKQLPSRLKTLQKACVAVTFEANPANCPAASVVGHAKAVTPVLPVPLTGPAYFVSHGGEAFPSLVVVLQGYGVTVDLVGSTFISKRGITSSTFKSVPDVPVSLFELVLPEGPDSALAAPVNLCDARKLVMPTEFVAQDAAVIHQRIAIKVTGCPKKARKAHSAKRARNR